MKDTTYKKYCLVVDEWFVNGFNGVKAYQKFYPNANEETASVKYNELVRIGKIEDYIKEKHKNTSERLKTSHEALLQELENWAYSDITETLTLDITQIKDLPSEIRRLIVSYKKSETRFGKDNDNIKTTIELKFVSKEKAMEMIHKHVGFYGEHNYQKNKSFTPEEREKRIKELKEKMTN